MLLPLSQRARIAVLGVLGAAAAFFVFGGLHTLGGGGPGDPFDAVPRDSFLIATVNLAELRRSPLYEVILGKESATGMKKAEMPILNPRALGIEKLADACGFDPLTRVERLALAVPEEGDKGELGVAAQVTVTRDELSKCTSALANKRGGKVDTKEIGSFAVVEDHGTDKGAAQPRLAYGHGGLLVAGRGAWFDAMLAAADGKRPGARDAQAHLALRTALTSREGWRSPTMVVTALLPRSLRDRLKSEMGAEVASQDTSQSIMGGVLGVASIGLAMRVGGSGQNIEGAIELVCDSDSGCAAVEKLILKKRLEWSKELMLRMVGFGPLLDSIDVKRDGSHVRVNASAPADALAATVDRVLRLKARREDDAPAPSDGRAAAPPSSGRPPDETIPAPRPSASVRR